MRKLFALFVALFMVAAVSAQTTIEVGGSSTIDATSLATTTTYDYVIADDMPYYMGWQVDLDSITGTAAGLGCVFEVEGSHDGVVFFDIDTLTYHGIVGTSTDTTAYENNTSALYWEYLRVKYTLSDTLQCKHTLVILPYISK